MSPLMVEAKSTKTFELPKAGVSRAVLAEIRDLGMVTTVFEGKSKTTPKVLFRWQLAELDKEGQPKRVYERFTRSLHQKAALRTRIKEMFSKEPPQTLDLEKIIGTTVDLVLVHNTKGDNTYANIKAVIPIAPGAPKLEIIAIPKKDEVAAAVRASEAELDNVDSGPISDQDVPF